MAREEDKDKAGRKGEYKTDMLISVAIFALFLLIPLLNMVLMPVSAYYAYKAAVNAKKGGLKGIFYWIAVLMILIAVSGFIGSIYGFVISRELGA